MSAPFPSNLIAREKEQSHCLGRSAQEGRPQYRGHQTMPELLREQLTKYNEDDGTRFCPGLNFSADGTRLYTCVAKERTGPAKLRIRLANLRKPAGSKPVLVPWRRGALGEPNRVGDAGASPRDFLRADDLPMVKDGQIWPSQRPGTAQTSRQAVGSARGKLDAHWSPDGSRVDVFAFRPRCGDHALHPVFMMWQRRPLQFPNGALFPPPPPPGGFRWRPVWF